MFERFNFSIEASKAAEILTKMCLKSEVLPDGKRLQVNVPPTRAGMSVFNFSTCQFFHHVIILTA